MEEQLKQFINEKRSGKLISLDEAATKQSIVLRLLSILGWDTYDIDEVNPEYSVGGKSIDYSLRIKGKNKVFLEVKRIKEELENHQEQLLGYAFHEGVSLAVLTNGISWWFYLPLQSGGWEQRKFLTINIIRQKDKDEIAANFIKILSKDNVSSGESIERAEVIHKSRQRQDIINSTLPKAWNKIISETNKALIGLINDVTVDLCGFGPSDEKIAKFINDYKLQLMISEKILITKGDKRGTRQRSSSGISKYVSIGYTGKGIKSFILDGETYEVKYWKDMLVKICGLMHKLYPNDFKKIVVLRGKKNRYFAYNVDELRSPKKIKGTNIFVETCFSANTIVKLCQDILSLFGYKRNNLKINLE